MFANVYWTVGDIPSKIEWDFTNGPRSVAIELLDTQVFFGSVKRLYKTWDKEVLCTI